MQKPIIGKVTSNSPTNNWSVYIIQASDNTYYTGITTNVERRFREHVSGKLGAKYFNGRKPIAVVYREHSHNRSSAGKREAVIKNFSRIQKQILIDSKSSG